jgi:hypothetical protein
MVALVKVALMLSTAHLAFSVERGVVMFPRAYIEVVPTTLGLPAVN